ncbi:MAG: acetyl-CoA carboxylase biotin carboxyl carrier protein subunit [Myxococcota bacterium]
MRRETIATLGAEEISVAVESLDDGLWQVHLGESSRAVDAREIRPGLWSLICEGRSYLIDLDRRKHATAVLVGTVEAELQLHDARQRQLAQAVSSRAGGGDEVVRAPIAGKVVKVAVAPGDAVRPGDRVVVLEAMKMENELKAERGGTVVSVHTEAGQSVDTGDRLVIIRAD